MIVYKTSYTWDQSKLLHPFHKLLNMLSNSYVNSKFVKHDYQYMNVHKAISSLPQSSSVSHSEQQMDQILLVAWWEFVWLLAVCTDSIQKMLKTLNSGYKRLFHHAQSAEDIYMGPPKGKPERKHY